MGVAFEIDDSIKQGFGEETWGKRPLGRPRSKTECKTEVNVTELRRKGVGWIYLAHDGENWRAVINSVLNIRVP
jgi:hypothetical protein